MFDDMSVREVESELVGMAGHLAAGTCRFLLLLAAFDRRDGWSGPGLRSCAQWLNWRIGMDARTAREHLRTAHALVVLPAVTAAFAAGRVSYSKVRALTRIATPDSEEMLLGVALHGTAAQLDRLVAAARAGGDARPAAARRGLHWRREVDGSITIRLRVPAEDGERLLAAVQAELDAAERDAAGRDGPAASGPAEPPPDDRDERIARAEEHTPGPVLDPAAARRADALLRLVHGQGHAGAAADAADVVVVHLREDEAWLESGAPVPLSTAERLACSGAVQALLTDRDGLPLRLGRLRRTASRAQLRALQARDGTTCAFPGCDATRHLDAHHVRWWRHGGRTDLDNLVLICGFHHRLVHDHGYRIEPAAPGRFTFRRPDGTPVPAAGPPTTGSADDLVAAHAANAIDGWTITPRWGGERLDPDPILRILQTQRPAAA